VPGDLHLWEVHPVALAPSPRCRCVHHAQSCYSWEGGAAAVSHQLGGLGGQAEYAGCTWSVRDSPRLSRCRPNSRRTIPKLTMLL
jgi:hypothetical protein